MPQEGPQTSVAVLMGGSSAERPISLLSGERVAAALRSAGFDVRVYDTADLSFIDALRQDKPNVAFPVLHGRGGEDGAIQGILETIGLPYVGSGILASALALDKVMSKICYRQNELLTAPFTVARNKPGFDRAAYCEHTVEQLGSHLVVKPAQEGSSIGMSIIDDAALLPEALELAFESDSTVLVEQFIAGTEVTVGVIGNDNPRALPVIEIISEGAFYDFESKYQPGQSHHIIPARLEQPVLDQLHAQACKAHEILGCRGISRTDFIVDASGISWALETNTLPGMTERSLVPDAANAVGIAFDELCTLLVELALE